MTQYSPQSPFEFASEGNSSEETATSNHPQQQPPESESADNHHLLLEFALSVERNGPMNTDSAYLYSSDSVEGIMNSESEDSTAHSSPEISDKESSSHSISALKPKSLSRALKDIDPPAAFASTMKMKRTLEDSTEGDDSQGNKMKKNEDEDSGSDSSKSLLQRLSGDDDQDDEEINVLKTILDYYFKNGTSPFDNMNALNDFFKNWLEYDGDSSKQNEKILQMREKYMKITKEIGDRAHPLGPRDQELFELSLKIWAPGTADIDGGSELRGNSKDGKV